MAFTKALYYPWIDISDESWLKNAALYWENIQTIVPTSIKEPYNTRTAQEFRDEGVLLPYLVEPDMPEIAELTDDVMTYLESPEGLEVLVPREAATLRRIHQQKFTQGIREIVDIHPDKIPKIIYRMLERGASTPERGRWVEVDARFADFYMTLLATHLSDQIGAGLLTDTAANTNLANAVKLGAKPFLNRNLRRIYELDDYVKYRVSPYTLAQGTLVDMIFDQIRIDPDTPARKILKFREAHSDELGRFRTKIEELTTAIATEQPLERLRQQTHDIYVNEVKPAIHSLKEGLTDQKIKWVTENPLKLTFFSTTGASVPLALLGLSVPQALIAGVGISLTTSAIMYSRQKAEMLRQNPYSYLLAIERKLS